MKLSGVVDRIVVLEVVARDGDADESHLMVGQQRVDQPSWPVHGNSGGCVDLRPATLDLDMRV